MISNRKRSILRGRKREHVKLGTAPGTIAVDPLGARPKITVMAFGPDAFQEREAGDPDEIITLMKDWPTVWVHVEGLSDAELITKLGEMFSLHKLALEDVVNRNQHPKLDIYDDHLYMVALAVPPEGGLDFGQVNMFVAENYVLTMQERNIGWDEPIRRRIREGRTRIRKLGANYLSFALLDSIVDNYYPVLEHYGDRLDALEEEVLDSPAQDEISRIHEIRNEILALRRGLMPLKDVTRTLSREDIPPITDETRLFYRDCNDHVTQLIDTIETDREIARGLIDLCLSSLSNRMNEVMKVLTIIATIFIPLSFIAGLYGMNFNPEASPYNMPELSWRLGYPFALLLMVVTVTGLLVYFRKKRWLWGKKRR